jgi:hypothetical protein
MSVRMTARVLRGVVGALAVAALMVPAAAAKGPGGGGGHGGGGGGGGTGEVAPNNLSVPAVIVGSSNFNITCDGYFDPPTGDPYTGYSVDGYYYVQGFNTWQAGCVIVDPLTVTATADWGDNLAGDAKLKVGAPIRVEVGLYDVAASAKALTGYRVIKLEPGELDRVSPYGTLAVGDTTSGFNAVPYGPYPVFDEYGVPIPGEYEARVFDPAASLTIAKLDSEGNLDTPVVSEVAGAEINATGRIVYGYNLRVQEAGTYRITYEFPNVNISGGTDGHSVSIDILVVPGGGGGGKNH